MNISKSEFQFLVETMAESLAHRVMNEHQCDILSALNRVYKSSTFHLVEDPATELAWQSPLYVYNLLQTENLQSPLKAPEV